ncbi:N-acetylmuramoyl-L-alanine amidase [Paracoccus isoporae]|uniref:N-acetylmuramoyl-L-alanine amidase n=1 Tax=Paracoccus isoporae TaxID=591205 RepID=A0A1G6XXX4_9RHOB|nr:N-acetylmuramoyl-L-alanine amidase [Paracoccus isoporae]SDD82950.1 N-acetylmuramoyl-L-alanine amidase [Paracoccus isoporae]
MRGEFPSPNHGERRGGLRPSLIVIHYTGMQDCAAARDRLCDPAAEVSAHWLIDEDGRAEALVPEDRRAWHAGAGGWQGQGDVNSRSIGIELVNPGTRPFAAAQMDALEELLRGIMARWQIGPDGVIGHSDMAPGRKCDPGPRFDWPRLARQGLALHPQIRGEDVPLADSLIAIGYPEAEPADRLAAFRLRFRPGASGAETETDRRIAAAAADLFASHRGA